LKTNPPVVAIVGAGRVGRVLGRRLRERGWRIGPVVTRSMRSARIARRYIGSGTPQAGLSEVVLAADLILIATPDRLIAETAAALAGLGGTNSFRGARQTRAAKRAGGSEWQGKIVLHTSGALGSEALEPLALCGAAVGSLHPLQTFSGRTAPSLSGNTCTVEGSAAAVRMARRVCRDLGCIPVVLPRRRKSAYHAAAVLSAGHVLGVMEAAVRMLVAVGFPRKRAVHALLLLTRQTLANYERLGARAAWTGPLSRDDFGVIERHLQALQRFPREYREAYAALSRLGVNVLASRDSSKKRELDKTLARIK
jgi:predicted short-subunit dehydrogenase-like oxidoreductase (DUF2520 family)